METSASFEARYARSPLRATVLPDDTGAVVAVMLQGADKGDATTLEETLCQAGMAVAEQIGREAELRPDEAPQVNVAGIEETVTDKGYHSGAVVKRMKAYEVRSYIPEKKQKGRRNWAGKPAEQQAVNANRRRVRGEYGKSLLRRRRRIGRAQLRALLRDGRAAALPSARTGKHSEAATDPHLKRVHLVAQPKKK